MTRETEGFYRPAGEGFLIVSHVDSGRTVGRDASGLPLIVWPDGHWCFLANAFMLRLIDRGLSRFNRGGSLGTYAAHLSHLLRYCAKNRIDFVELSDAHFTLFINSLKAARFKPSSASPRLASSSVIAVAQTCLSFLSFVGEVYSRPLVGPDAAIRAELVSSRGKGRSANRWYHHAFPTPSPAHKRLPVSSDIIQALRQAAAVCSSSNYLLRRRQVMLWLLEVTGGRRSEIANLTVKSVQRAAAMQAPRLELVTMKGRGHNKNQHREVPISKADARVLLEFSRVSRAVAIRRTCGANNDCGALLIAETSGQALRPNTITQEMALLCDAAQLELNVCAHMFRHRFITNVFKALIEEYQAVSSDAFRQLLLSADELKTRVCEWTGHANISSLDTYIHLAFEEVGGVRLAVDAVRAKSAIKLFASELNALDLTNMTPAQFETLRRSISDLSEELSPKDQFSAAASSPSSRQT